MLRWCRELRFQPIFSQIFPIAAKGCWECSRTGSLDKVFVYIDRIQSQGVEKFVRNLLYGINLPGDPPSSADAEILGRKNISKKVKYFMRSRVYHYGQVSDSYSWYFAPATTETLALSPFRLSAQGPG
jgi:hypothetical protein